MITPASLPELRDAVLSAPRVIAVGAQTKPRLCEVDAVKISMLQLRGITEYEPSEFTFTALAGTSVREIIATLAQSGQYLPFDPMLVDAGSTLGGVVASGLSGPGRFRFGGVRDFILGVRFVDGLGRLLRMGGKVVKNAAGFDLPKFFTGSLGRFGVLGEITFKVFPRPASTLTLKVTADVRTMVAAARSRWELDALDVLPDSNHLLMRLAGPDSALHVMAREIFDQFPGEIISNDCWASLREFRWAHPHGVLLKAAITTDQISSLRSTRCHISAGGNVAYLSLPGTVELESIPLAALTLRGDAPLWVGQRRRSAIEVAVKAALDPQNRFPSLDD